MEGEKTGKRRMKKESAALVEVRYEQRKAKRRNGRELQGFHLWTRGELPLHEQERCLEEETVWFEKLTNLVSNM